MTRWFAFSVVLASAQAALAADVAVPIALQAALLSKVAAYDKNLATRAGASVEIALLVKAADGDSERVVKQMRQALASMPNIGGLPHHETIVEFTDAAALAQLCRDRHLAIVYVGPGFADAEIAGLAKALSGVDVLTAAAMPTFVEQGIVLGFDLVSGKPRLLLHLTQAKEQHVMLGSDVLSLMKVVR